MKKYAAELLTLATAPPLLLMVWLVARWSGAPFALLASVFATGLAVATTIIFTIVRWPLRRSGKTGAFDVGQSMSQFVRTCGATATFKDLGDEARATKVDVDAVLRGAIRGIECAVCKGCQRVYDASRSYKGHCGQACFYREVGVAVARTPVPVKD